MINPNKIDNNGRFIESREENGLKINLDYVGLARQFAQWVQKKFM